MDGLDRAVEKLASELGEGVELKAVSYSPDKQRRCCVVLMGESGGYKELTPWVPLKQAIDITEGMVRAVRFFKKLRGLE